MRCDTALELAAAIMAGQMTLILTALIRRHVSGMCPRKVELRLGERFEEPLEPYEQPSARGVTPSA